LGLPECSCRGALQSRLGDPTAIFVGFGAWLGFVGLRDWIDHSLRTQTPIEVRIALPYNER
jgi:hypothetical protein